MERKEAVTMPSKQGVAGSIPAGRATQPFCFQHPFTFPLIAKDGIVKKPSENWL